jgi:hypothetical protein
MRIDSWESDKMAEVRRRDRDGVARLTGSCRHAGEDGIRVEVPVAGSWQSGLSHERPERCRVVPSGSARVNIAKSTS